MFEIILALAGYYFFGFFGALLGYFVGGSIDRARNLGIGGVNPLGTSKRKDVFLETVFTLMGKLAKADGVITQSEIDHVEHFIEQMGMTAEHRTQAITQFKQGAAVDFDITQTLNTFMVSCGQTLNLKQMLVVYLIVIAIADGVLDKAEVALLEHIASRLGYSHAQFQQLLEMVLSQSHFSSGAGNAGQASASTALADAYKAIGVTESNSEQEIKRAYRKLMSQYHPDKLMGQGLPDDMIAIATEKAKEIQIAYDLIKERRGI